MLTLMAQDEETRPGAVVYCPDCMESGEYEPLDRKGNFLVCQGCSYRVARVVAK